VFREEMPRADYVSCKSCGRRREEVGTLSHTRLCADCATWRLERNVRGIATKTGPAFVRQLVGMAKYIESQRERALAQPTSEPHTP